MAYSPLGQSRKRKSLGIRPGSMDHTGMTYELLQQLLKRGKFMPNIVRRLKTLSEEQIRWVVDTDGEVNDLEQLESLHRSFSIHADAEAEKCAGSFSYTWQKAVTAVVADCADQVVEMNLPEEEEKRALFDLLRGSLVGQEAARLIEEGKLVLADVEGDKMRCGKERNLAYVRNHSAIDRKMSALEGWYMASTYRSGTLSCSSVNLYGQTIRAATSEDSADIEAWNQKVSKDWMKNIRGKYPDRLEDVVIEEEALEFSVGIGERIWLTDDGVWMLSQKQSDPTPAPRGLVLAAILQFHKEEVVNIGGKTILTVLRSADSVGESIWQQYKLHKMYRASGHERAVPQPFPELDEATCKAGVVSPEGALKLASETAQRIGPKLETMPVWCLQHEVAEVLDAELQLVRTTKRDLCGFHPVFKDAQHPGLFFIGTLEDFNSKFEKQRSALTKFLSGWRNTALKALGTADGVQLHGRGSRGGRRKAAGPKHSGWREDGPTSTGVEEELWSVSAGVDIGKTLTNGVVRLSALQGEIDEQINLLQSQMMERMERLAEAHVQQVAQLRAITEQQIQGMQQAFTSQMADIKAQTKAQVMQLGKMVQTFSGK